MMEKLRDMLAPIMVKLPPVQHTALGFVSETAIEYRSSSVVEDLGGDGALRAGDRLPDLKCEAEQRRYYRIGPFPGIEYSDLISTTTMSRRCRTTCAMPMLLSWLTADLDDEGKHLLGREAKMLVLRPDGYVGFRSKAGYQAELMDYARQDALV